jgi:hypothetical protein
MVVIFNTHNYQKESASNLKFKLIFQCSGGTVRFLEKNNCTSAACKSLENSDLKCQMIPPLSRLLVNVRLS